MQLIPISDIHDARIQHYADVRDKDLSRRDGLFMAEGRVVLEALLSSGRTELHSVLVSENRVSKLRELLERVPDAVPVYVLPRKVMFEVVGFPIHRGLLAAGKRPPHTSPASLLSQIPPGPATILVLEGLTNHDNTGACFRNAAAFGVDGVLLDDRCCDPLYRKSIRVSVGHTLNVPWSHGAPMPEILAALKEAGFTTVALALDPSATSLSHSKRPAPRLALLLGTEGPGLAPETMKSCDQKFYIPMAPGVDSLNVATAGAVALFATLK